METSTFMGGFYKLLEWISRLAFLNILWISFSLLGLVIFGFFPATVAMFSVVRKWMLGKEDVSIFKTFWTAYKREFLKSNLLGLMIFAIGIVLYIDFQFIQNAANSFVSILYVPFFIITFIFISMLFYIIPIFVHYDMNISQVIKNSFFVMIMNPLSTFYMLIGSFGICFALSYAPPICILYSGNLLALFIMKPATNAFEKINQKSKLVLN
ncbi:YesL family protein [Bacillus sp. ISL-46]|uniref:YesL family protein n=1 Tax=Bacillus sp. ISL-46 TaxID=2819129 RepID=UPI001BE6A55B|nr:YesL family protein [Bacillus sp. ISL-46]MBT2720546.1 YesL family protein [Bacillus sp. ISL-46]